METNYETPKKLKLILIKDNKECDGKNCGTLIRITGPKYICAHNNFSVTHPELAKQWDYEKNKHPPSYYTYGSTVKVHWICPVNPCGCHNYCSTINGRTSNDRGCKFCNSGSICIHNNLTVTHEKLCKEWDYERNEKGPENYTYGVDVKVFWICPINPFGCHNYEAMISSRTKENPTGCRFCNSGAACPHNNLTTTHCEIAKQWDYERNEKGPENYTYGNHFKARWICPINPCGCHRYEAAINLRTTQNTGCKYCNKGSACPHNNLTTTHKLLCNQWDYQRNEKGPKEYTYGSNKKVFGICDNNHSYKIPIVYRTNYSGCSLCNTTRYSKISIEWINNISEKENVYIQCATNNGEYKIEGIGKVDGYCLETNTVYEFHGDF